MTTNATNRAAPTGPVHDNTLRPATDNTHPTVGDVIAALTAELDRGPSLWWQGYEYGHACGYAAALETIRREHPRLVLLDATMPGLSGFDVCEAVRADAAVRDTRILMLTAKGRETDIARGVGAGADAYVTKPFSTRDLVQKVRDMLA